MRAGVKDKVKDRLKNRLERFTRPAIAFTPATAFILAFILATAVAAAQGNVPSGLQPLLDKINTIIKSVQVILITVSVLVFMYAGFLHMTSEGQPEKEQKARRAFTGAIIGLAIVVLAELIKNVIVSILS